MDKPEITNVEVQFLQDGNTLGTTSEYEELDIRLEFQLGEEDGPFYVIKSETGWSFSDISDLKVLIDRVERVLENNEEDPA